MVSFAVNSTGKKSLVKSVSKSGGGRMFKLLCKIFGHDVFQVIGCDKKIVLCCRRCLMSFREDADYFGGAK